MVAFLPKTVEDLRLSVPSGECVHYTSDGIPYEEMSCLYPSWGMTFLPFELNYDYVPAKNWVIENHWWFTPTAVLGYVLMILGGRMYFKDRKPLNWRSALIAWNFVLSVFSIWGFVRTFPAMIHYIFHFQGPSEWYCTAPENSVYSGSTGFWFQMWVLSKFPEFIDTLFLVVHKKPLIFLHPFHHVVTFAGSMWGYRQSPPPAAIGGVVMNYGVHAVMYLYYMLMAMKRKPKWFNPFWITAGQLGQMVIGFGLGAYALLKHEEMPAECNEWFRQMMNTTIVIYFAFGFLFAQIFVRRYFLKVDVEKKKTA